MLQPAILYEKEVLEKLHSTWHEDKYKWIYVDGFADNWTIEPNGWNYVQFVSVYKNKILGFIQYQVMRNSRNVRSLIVVGFENNLLFIKDLLQAIDDIFNKFRFHKLSFSAVLDNPATRVYDKYIEKIGGVMYGISKEQWLLQDGCYHHAKHYEILGSNYKKLPRGKNNEQ